MTGNFYLHWLFFIIQTGVGMNIIDSQKIPSKNFNIQRNKNLIPDTFIQYLASAKTKELAEKREDINTRYLHSDEDWLQRKAGKHFEQIFGNPSRKDIEINALIHELANVKRGHRVSDDYPSKDYGAGLDFTKRGRNWGQLKSYNLKYPSTKPNDLFGEKGNDIEMFLEHPLQRLHRLMLDKRRDVENNLSEMLDELEDEINNLNVADKEPLYRDNHDAQLQPKDFLADGENLLDSDRGNQLFKNSPYAKTWLLDVLDVPMQDQNYDKD